MVDETRSQLAHLFRRAGFGARPAELDHYVARGFAAAVDDLVAGRPIAGAAVTRPSTPATGPVDDPYDRAVLKRAQAGWLSTMVTTSAPLVEKMALFLHGHFATSFLPGNNIGVTHMEDQLALFRTYALGNFRSLCRVLLEDFALACWLDADLNHKAAPNENLARELMELFTLGTGVYTETDVREAARALTGYKLVKDESPMMLGVKTMGRTMYRLVFDSSLHDYGEKRILGRTGTFMPADVVDIVLAHDAAPTWLAAKLVSAFQSATPSPSLVSRIAATLRAQNWELAPALRKLFSAREFLSPASYAAVVKTPADFVAQGMRALGRTEWDTAVNLVVASGQSLFEPPTVAGWTPNEGWLGAGQLLGRYNTGVTLGRLHAQTPARGLPTGVSVDAWLDVFGGLALSPVSRAAVDRYIRETSRTHTPERQAGLITLLVASPEFSLA